MIKQRPGPVFKSQLGPALDLRAVNVFRGAPAHILPALELGDVEFRVAGAAEAAPNIIHKGQVALGHPAALGIDIQAVKIELVGDQAVIRHPGADANKAIGTDLVLFIDRSGNFGYDHVGYER